MKFDWTFPALKFNPFSMVEHNTVKLPRIIHHSLHVALGLIAGIPGIIFHWPLIVLILLGVAIAIWDKHMWIDVPNKKIHWWIPPYPEVMEGYDFMSDLGLTILGATIGFWGLWVIPTYYLLSLVNDP